MDGHGRLLRGGDPQAETSQVELVLSKYGRHERKQNRVGKSSKWS